MAKRGDTKTQNGIKYRYGYKNGKLQWIKAHEGLNLAKATGKKLLKIGKGVSDLTGNVSRKVFGNPKTTANKKYNSETWTKKPNNKMALNNLASLNYFIGDLMEAENIYELSIKNNNSGIKYNNNIIPGNSLRRQV